MDYLSLIKAPIVNELDSFIKLFNSSLTHDGELQEEIFARIRERAGKRMRPMLILLMAKAPGDYILSTALLHVALTENNTIVKYLAELGRTLSNGEILQLTNISNDNISEDVYFQVIRQKTAALFEACCSIGALSAGAGSGKWRRRCVSVRTWV